MYKTHTNIQFHKANTTRHVRSQNQHNTLMVGDFNTIHLAIDWSPGQKLNKEMIGLNEIIN